MHLIRVITAIIKDPITGKDPGECGINIILDKNHKPLGMNYWTNVLGCCPFCGSIGAKCVHSTDTWKHGKMILWDAQQIINNRGWKVIPLSQKSYLQKMKWWRFDHEAYIFVKNWLKSVKYCD